MHTNYSKSEASFVNRSVFYAGSLARPFCHPTVTGMSHRIQAPPQPNLAMTWPPTARASILRRSSIPNRKPPIPMANRAPVKPSSRSHEKTGNAPPSGCGSLFDTSLLCPNNSNGNRPTAKGQSRRPIHTWQTFAIPDANQHARIRKEPSPKTSPRPTLLRCASCHCASCHFASCHCAAFSNVPSLCRTPFCQMQLSHRMSDNLP